MLKILSVIFIFSMAIGCSKSPKAYNGKTLPPGPVDLAKAVPTEKDFEKKVVPDSSGKPVPIEELLNKTISDEVTEGSFAFDAKVKAHSSLPIVYKQGAAGITFDTTLADAENLLVKPRSGPDADGYALYDEGLYILWRKDTPRTPVFILVLQNYLGDMALPVPYKPVGMGYDFSKDGYKVNKKEGAEALARDYYRGLENKDGSFDCIREQVCKINWGDESKKDFTFEIPGRLIWLVSKDRFVLFRMLLQEAKPALPFNFNLLAGDLVVPNEKSLGLGQSYGDVEGRLNELLKIEATDIKTSVSSDTFGRQYDGSALIYQKTVFDRQAVTPLPSDKMSMIQVWDSYPALMMFDDKYVVVSETVNGVELRTATADEVDKLQETIDRRDIPLKVRIGLQQKNVKNFVIKMKDLLASELKTKYPTATISSRFVGEFQRKTLKDYSAYIVAFDKTKNEGLFVQFGAEEEQGNLTSFTTLKLGGDMNPMDPLIFGDISAPVEKVVGDVPVISSVTGQPIAGADGRPLMKKDKMATFTSLSGFNIGDTVFVKDWDLGRGEATIQVVTAGKTHPSLRANYDERSVTMVAFDAEKEVPQEVAYASFGSLNIGIGMVLVDETTDLRTYKVVSVTSNVNVTSVKDLCGGAFSPTFGMNSTQFIETLSKTTDCVYMAKKDSGGNGRLVSVYFPNDRIRLSFDEEELVAATIYSPKSEVH